MNLEFALGIVVFIALAYIFGYLQGKRNVLRAVEKLFQLKMEKVVKEELQRLYDRLVA